LVPVKKASWGFTLNGGNDGAVEAIFTVRKRLKKRLSKGPEKEVPHVQESWSSGDDSGGQLGSFGAVGGTSERLGQSPAL
jgi:hypothetical protein